MRIAICDDEEMSCALLVALLKKYISTHEDQQVTYAVFSHADDLLKASVIHDGFDVYILDVMMPDTNGIDLGVKLRQNGDDGLIIYQTSSSEYAIDSYNVKAFGYLLKPVELQKLFSVLEDAWTTLASKAQKSIIVKTKSGHTLLPINNILYAESSRRIIVYHLINNDTVESTTLRVPFADAMQELLSYSRFALCSKGTVVNLSHITGIENDEVIFSGNIRVYFNKKNCQTIRSLWTDFWFNKEN